MAYAALDEAYQTITNPKEYIKINNKENKVSGKNKKTKKTKQKKIENFDNVNLDLSNSIEQTMVNQNNYDYNVVEPFANPDDVIHEYSPLSEEDSDVDLESQNNNKSNKKSNYIGDSDTDSDNDNEIDSDNNNSHDNMVNNSKRKNISDNNSHTHEIKNEIREINKKINFILNKINQDSKISQIDDTNNIDKNMHDIILFIIFGAFIILVLDSLCRLIIKNNLRA